MFEDDRPEVDGGGGTDGEDDAAGGGGGGAGDGEPRDIDAVRASAGRGVFYVESRPTQVIQRRRYCNCRTGEGAIVREETAAVRESLSRVSVSVVGWDMC